MIDPPSTNDAGARAIMVEAQVRPNQVSDARVLAAMRALPREAFAPVGANAYADTDIPLGEGRFMLAPMTIARMAQLVLASHPEKILVIGAGGGYGAALLAAVGARVVALEAEPRLQSPGLAAYAPGVLSVSGKLEEGWAREAPYDAILIEGAVAEIPAILAAQLKRPGFLVTILAKSKAAAGLGAIVQAEPGLNGFAIRPVFDCAARILPAFRPAPVFEF